MFIMMYEVSMYRVIASLKDNTFGKNELEALKKYCAAYSYKHDAPIIFHNFDDFINDIIETITNWNINIVEEYANRKMNQIIKSTLRRVIKKYQKENYDKGNII